MIDRFDKLYQSLGKIAQMIMSKNILSNMGMITVLLLAGCVQKPTDTPLPRGMLSVPTITVLDSNTISLRSLEKVDDYPLYVMNMAGILTSNSQDRKTGVRKENWFELANFLYASAQSGCTTWACALFATLGDASNYLYGRNFDWEYSPALLLFSQPDDAYASVSVVDIAYLDFSSDQLLALEKLPIEERYPLLEAVNLPFDGMNEKGLVIGMAAVPPGNMPVDPAKPTLDSLAVIRLALDRAATIDEAIKIFKTNNIDWGSGPPLHYLLADRSGKAVLIEIFQGEMLVHYNQNPYHLATNFLVSENPDQPLGHCWRYDRIAQTLKQNQGKLSLAESLGLLSQVSQDITQWSVIYDFSSLKVNIVMGRSYNTVHAFSLAEITAP
jgi:hypothetical protein